MSGDAPPPVDLARARARLAARRGPAYWRSLEELAETPEFLAYLKNEFPPFAEAAAGALDRRRFLQLMGASMALAGLAACGPEPAPRELLPYVEQPLGIVPGRSRYFSTATLLEGYARGVMLEHQMGRPIKVEGNPDHPESRGATDAIGQASILGLYDPNRAQALSHKGGIATWAALIATLVERRRRLAERHGAGLYLLTGTVTSPTLAAQIDGLRRDFPEMRWHQWEPLNRDTLRDGARLAFGRPVDTLFDFTKADVILALDGDFLDAAPGHLRYARDFAARRRAGEVKERMSRLYAIESTPTLAGAKADHRLMLRPHEAEGALRFIAARLGAAPADWAAGDQPKAAQLDAVAEDLRQHKGRALVQAGRGQGAATHALVHAVNGALGAMGETVHTIEPVEAAPTDQTHSLAALVEDMAGGKVDTLVILGVNAVYDRPADIDFAAALARVDLSIYLGEYVDETAQRCVWHVPQAHEYEAWSDARAHDGTVTILQPQVRPFFAGRSAHELLAALGGDIKPDGLTILRSRWERAVAAQGADNFESFWRDALRVGVVLKSEAGAVRVSVRSDLVESLPAPANPPADGLTLLFRPDPGVWDGRFAENGWLQEMPRPFTRLTWDNVAAIAPATAERLGLAEADAVEVVLGDAKVLAPVWILPGQAHDCVTLHLGYGRSVAGPVGYGVGFDAYRLRRAGAAWRADGATLQKTGRKHLYASVQHQGYMEGRDLVREGDLADFIEDPGFLRHDKGDASLYPGFRYVGNAWAMSISLNSCIGCQACVVACVAENNSPVVGKNEVFRGRDMHWLRIDRYYEGELDDPAMHFEPVPCMHCENAPCEVVCPVNATVHDSDGLNVMVYNRCVGTRFCSNNCPYKVRRFNFFGFAEMDPRPRESWNPEVTVRGRGVMEKCTYCIQRIRAAQIDADRENRPIADGEITTACQQACPTQAIVFGDRNDPESAVAKRKASPLDYPLLDDLNTRPRTTYEAAIRNRNPKMGKV